MSNIESRVLPWNANLRVMHAGTIVILLFSIARCCCRLLYPYNDINVAISCCYMICIHCINGSTYRYLVKVLFNVITVCLCNLMAYTYTIIRHIVILHWHVDECSWIKNTCLLVRTCTYCSIFNSVCDQTCYSRFHNVRHTKEVLIQKHSQAL